MNSKSSCYHLEVRIVDREAELSQLRQLAASNRPALVVLTGRRRVGKSFLLHAAFGDGRVVSFQADEQDERGQLMLLAREAARLLPGRPPLTFGDWDAALRFFGTQAEAESLVVVLDEFQYLCASQPALPSLVQRHWDEWERRNLPICLVLCGSALSFMEGLLSHGAPLYGRATYRPLLLPVDYRDAAEFAASGTSPTNLIRRYAVVGGTPQYQVWAGHRPLPRLIREVILTKGAPLYEEPLQLLRAEEGIREPRGYFSALRAVAAGKTRTAQIANEIELDISQTSRLLDRLAELGYVEVREPLAPARQAARALWWIADPYFRFWFRYVSRNRSRLERELVNEVFREIESDFETYMGWAFEDVCRTWVARYSEVGRASTRTGSWWSRRGDAEIDVVAMRDRDYTLLGSCKWGRQAGERVLDELYNQRAVLGGRAAQARLAVFARDGFSTQLREQARAEGVLLIGVTELFAEPPPS